MADECLGNDEGVGGGGEGCDNLGESGVKVGESGSGVVGLVSWD